MLIKWVQNNYKFLIANFIFWGVIMAAFTAPMIYIPKLNVLKYHIWQYILDGFMDTIFLVFASFILKSLYHKFVVLDDFNLWQFTKVILFCILASGIFVFLLYLYTNFSVLFIYDRPDILESTIIKKSFYILNFIFFIFLFFIWSVAYTMYKSILKLKNDKIEKTQLESNLKESQLNVLKGQINPHFMFNSLNNIRGLILENPENSRDMITRLSEMLRYSLTKNDIDTIALEEEIEMVENFIAISKIQLEERLQFVSEIAPETLPIKIPPMIIQLLIENAIKHGIATIKDGGEITLRTTIENNNLTILVSNTGKLVIVENTTQVGLKNIEERLHLLYGNDAIFKLKQKEDKVVATIVMPII
ncbi:sensor histidine kinase [Flavobacterium laiguense]|uniref:Histidine kinase n=1 Tax=Flavobacterium laiguense TaxID=2169409 RepID=A0A2U1K3F2_9FLAO|nr:histidine kinase [Flavobacterium laiguense]PWA11503.1 histidine kinase [Flavobacterium laiguense]